MTLKIELALLLFTYGFTLAYHLIGTTKYCSLKEFDWHKAIIGITNEIGFVIFWYLIYLLPQYADLSTLGLDLNLELITTVILIYPLSNSIKLAYNKAIELKNLDTETIPEVTNEVNLTDAQKQDKYAQDQGWSEKN